jgi:hypothetical protein
MGVFNAKSILGQFLGVDYSTGDLVGKDGLVAVRHPDNRIVVNDGASLTVTQDLHDGKTIVAQGTGAAYTYTLPAATGSGMKVRFVIGEVNTSNTIITVTGDDEFYGNIISNSTGDTPDLAAIWPTAANTDTITLNGTTTGGVALGDWVEVEDFLADCWAVRGIVTASGAEATPFSGS